MNGQSLAPQKSKNACIFELRSTISIMSDTMIVTGWGTPGLHHSVRSTEELGTDFRKSALALAEGALYQHKLHQPSACFRKIECHLWATVRVCLVPVSRPNQAHGMQSQCVCLPPATLEPAPWMQSSLHNVHLRIHSNPSFLESCKRGQ
jgi:hypothetical protein